MKPFIEFNSDQFTLSSFQIEPIHGYEKPVNKETGEEFPKCCPFHNNVFEAAKSWYEQFPDCCEEHSALSKKSWFKKSDYEGMETGQSRVN